MSRCFPYPPPGYEPRLSSEHKDVQKKERHKGKKHRKENGREKGERKENDKGKGERKGNDRGHKKFKREKHREKRKSKDRDKHNHQTSEKELDALHENGKKTTKLPRMCPITCVNEKTTPHSQRIETYSSTELVGASANAQEVNRHMPQDGYSNGITGSRYLEKQKDSVSSSVCDRNEGYLKPPHPDTKYLSQAQSIPPRDDISEAIDQDWLFSEDRVEREAASVEAAESSQVWSDVQVISTAGVVALPYVIPL